MVGAPARKKDKARRQKNSLAPKFAFSSWNIIFKRYQVFLHHFFVITFCVFQHQQQATLQMKIENFIFAGLCVVSGSGVADSFRLGGMKSRFLRGNGLQMAPRPPVPEDSSYTIAILGDCKSMTKNLLFFIDFGLVCL